MDDDQAKIRECVEIAERETLEIVKAGLEWGARDVVVVFEGSDSSDVRCFELNDAFRKKAARWPASVLEELFAERDASQRAMVVCLECGFTLFAAVDVARLRHALTAAGETIGS